jgi:hypothetical protein
MLIEMLINGSLAWLSGLKPELSGLSAAANKNAGLLRRVKK